LHLTATTHRGPPLLCNLFYWPKKCLIELFPLFACFFLRQICAFFCAPFGGLTLQASLPYVQMPAISTT
jgi:hypothetical protein